MDKNDLFRALGNIDEDFIEEANDTPRKHSAFPKLLTACACLALILCAGWGGGYLLKNYQEYNPEPRALCADVSMEAATPVSAMPPDFAFGAALGSDVWFYDSSTYILTWEDVTNTISMAEEMLQTAWESVAALNWEDYPETYQLGNLSYEGKEEQQVSFTITENEQTHVVRFYLEELFFGETPEAQKLLQAFLSCRRATLDTAVYMKDGNALKEAQVDVQYSSSASSIPADFSATLRWGEDSYLRIQQDGASLQKSGEAEKALDLDSQLVLGEIWKIAQDMDLAQCAASLMKESNGRIELQITADGAQYVLFFSPTEILADKDMESQRLLEILQICCQAALAQE